MLRRYEQPFRPAYEVIAAVAWLGGAAYFLWIGLRGNPAPNLMLGLCCACLVMCVVRARSALNVMIGRAALSGRAVETMTHEELRRQMKDPDQVFFGYGFEWTPKHSQRLYDLQALNFRGLLAPRWLLRFAGVKALAQPDSEIGMPYIHGVEPREVAIRRPIFNLDGGTGLIGTTQSGKTTAFSVLGSQAVYRGDTVIVIDPKNSRRLKDNIQYACEQSREPDTFLDFHPAFPERGVRLDPTYNFQKVTELASRIKALLPPSKEGSFENFAWDAVNVVCQACVLLEDRPNLLKIKQYIELGIEPLLMTSLERHFALHAPGWRDRTRGSRAPRNNKLGPHVTDELWGMVQFYEHDVAKANRSQIIDAQVRVFKHPREHYQRITASLLPILNSLTSGDLGRSLSPDPFDPHDKRPIFNIEKIVKGRHVLYLSLDSLPDAQVASAIGATFLADLAAYMGMRYNLRINKPRITVLIDEASSVMCQSAIELMNKGAEAGAQVIIGMQTLADLAHRLGSEHAARMVLGNVNNCLCLRSKDRETMQFMAETFGEVPIQKLDVGVTAHTDDNLPDFSAAYSRRVTEQEMERVPLHVLAQLPNMQYFASLSGGRIYKARMPILLPGPLHAEDETAVPSMLIARAPLPA